MMKPFSAFQNVISKIFDPVFDGKHEHQSVFNASFDQFYDQNSFKWTTSTFSFLPNSETLKIQALYAKLVPFFECTSLVHIHKKSIRLLNKNIFGAKKEITSVEIDFDISKTPYYQWVRMSANSTSKACKDSVLKNEFGISESDRFQIFVFRIRPDYTLLVATAQAEPWLKVKLEALSQQIVLGFCDHE